MINREIIDNDVLTETQKKKTESDNALEEFNKMSKELICLNKFLAAYLIIVMIALIYLMYK